MAHRKLRLPFVFLTIGLCAILPMIGQATASVRTVRISYLYGQAVMERMGAHRAVERVVLNMPITSGIWVFTPDKTRMEIEFERNDTVRVADDSALEFQTLGLDDSGAKINIVRVHHGVIYLNFSNMRAHDKLTLVVCGREVEVTKASRVRITATENAANIHIKGTARLVGEHPMELHNQSISLATDSANVNMAKAESKLPSDQWNEQRESQHTAQAPVPEPSTDLHRAGERMGKWRRMQTPN